MLKLSYAVSQTNPGLLNLIKGNGVFLEVLKDHVHRKRIEMLLILEEDNRKKGIHRRGNEQYIISSANHNCKVPPLQ